MHGSSAYQVKILYQKSGIDQIGTSKHEAKATARNAITANGRSNTWHAIGKQLGIHSYATQNAYRDVWKHVLEFARQNFGEKDIEKLTAEHVVAFLQNKVNQGVAHATFMQYSSAIEKMETALNMYSQSHNRGQHYNFSNQIKAIRQEAHEKLERFKGRREYRNPQAVIENLKNADHRLVAKLQLEAGLRIKETNMIHLDQLKPNNMLEVRGGKGGKPRTVSLPADLYRKLEEKINSSNNNTFKYNPNSYRYYLGKAAVVAAGETFKGKSTHGLRWNFAQKEFQELQREEHQTYEQAENNVSRELGHNRADMTQHYLGK